MSSRSAGGSAATGLLGAAFFGAVLFGVVVGVVVAGVVVAGGVVVVLGVEAVTGIFGGLTAVVGTAGWGVGVVAGVVGVAAGGGVAEAVAAGTCTTTMWRTFVLVSAAYAAPAAPRASNAVAARITALQRQLGVCVPRLPGAGVPHCRHHSWASSIEAPHFLHFRSLAAGAGAGAEAEDSGAGGCSGGVAAGGSASNVDTEPDSSQLTLGSARVGRRGRSPGRSGGAPHRARAASSSA